MYSYFKGCSNYSHRSVSNIFIQFHTMYRAVNDHFKHTEKYVATSKFQSYYESAITYSEEVSVYTRSIQLLITCGDQKNIVSEHDFSLCW